jgi:hypothetical protein
MLLLYFQFLLNPDRAVNGDDHTMKKGNPSTPKNRTVKDSSL